MNSNHSRRRLRKAAFETGAPKICLGIRGRRGCRRVKRSGVNYVLLGGLPRLHILPREDE